MARQQKIIDIFPKHLFWDVNMASLDVNRDKGLIIPRALFATNEQSFENDMIKLESLYSKSTILAELQATRERISNEVCEWVAQRYHVPTFYRWKYEGIKR